MLSKALEGIQPTLRQVPPSAPLFYMQTVFNPSWAALIAATYPDSNQNIPPGPPPITARSKAF